MKSAIPMIALLALCSPAETATLRRPGYHNDSPSPRISVIAHDLSFNPDAVRESLPAEPETGRVTTGIDTRVVLSQKQLTNREPEIVAVPASEPPPVTTIALALTFLALAGVIGRTRTERRRLRRRTVVRMREIIAAR